MSAPIPAPTRAPTIVKASSIFFVISIFKFSFSLSYLQRWKNFDTLCRNMHASSGEFAGILFIKGL